MKDTLKEEFEQFKFETGSTPPRRVTDAIFTRVSKDLNPSAPRVFSKLMAIHFATALVTLSICPQFGVRVLGEGLGLMHIFMRFGAYGCLVACGAFFTGTSLMVASLVLQAEEVRKIRKHRLLTLGALTLLSLGFFIMLDAQIVLGFAMAWFVGALVGSWLSLEASWVLKSRAALAP